MLLPVKENQFKFVIGGDGKPKSKSVSDIVDDEIKQGRKIKSFNTYQECMDYILSIK